MSAIADSWIFAVFMGIIAIYLMIALIITIWKRRSNPMDPEDKALNRRLLIDFFSLAFGFRRKDNDNKESQEKEDQQFNPDA